MILINLLPPELRRRRSTSLNPMFAGTVGGGLLVLLAIGGYGWLKFSRMPYAEAELARLQTDLAEKTAKADAVLKREAIIVEFEKRRDNILALINRKVYWARTIDDFANLLAGQWSIDGFHVRAQELTISEMSDRPNPGAAGKKGATDVRYSFKWRYKILGDEDRSGDYINSFFKTVEHGRFWSENGFVGKPEERYDGDRPRWNGDLQKVVVEGNLDWQRLKLAAKPAAPGRPKQGN